MISFVPLLQAELDEMRRRHAERMTEWPHHRLLVEGVMLERLSAVYMQPQPKLGDDRVVYQFSRTGKDATRRSHGHKFM